MGQNSSLPKPSGRRSLRSPLLRRSKSHRRTLSHTFTMIDNDDKIELLNVNLASEEELMTLPGISREVARSIVDHRKAIGRFKKVEDLALVRGIGADKLEQIRPEICVSRKLNGSSSSRAQSFDSLKSQDSRLTIRTNKSVNINKATVFELQNVRGITQEIAASIVDYRNRKGPFKRVDDLIKIKRIDCVRLGNISQFLCISEDSIEKISVNGVNTPANFRKCNGTLPKLGIANGISNSSVFDIFELLSTYSPRPILEETFDYQRQGESAVRIALWNLEKFSYEKASNLGVKEVVCRTILENSWSIIAIQEIEDIKALQIICDELNKPKLRRVAEWSRNSKDWCISVLDAKNSKLGFLYDAYSAAIEIELKSIKEGPRELRHTYEAIVGTFRVGELNLNLINTKIGSTVGFDVNDVNFKLEEFIPNNEVTLVLGEFSCISDSFEEWTKVEYLQTMLQTCINTSNSTNGRDKNSHDFSNIYGNSKALTQLTGISGIVREGLSHLAIPAGWNWGGTVSSHHPLWTEIYVMPNSGTAL